MEGTPEIRQGFFRLSFLSLFPSSPIDRCARIIGGESVMLRHYPSERYYRCHELEQPDAATLGLPDCPAVFLEMDIAASPIHA